VYGVNSKSLRSGSWKYIHDYVDPEQHRLFDLARDPGEQRNLLTAERERAKAMAIRLAELVREDDERRLAPDPVTLTPEQVERLKALGYAPANPSKGATQ
jgi:arylsulfatase A-like enzyme